MASSPEGFNNDFILLKEIFVGLKEFFRLTMQALITPAEKLLFYVEL